MSVSDEWMAQMDYQTDSKLDIEEIIGNDAGGTMFVPSWKEVECGVFADNIHKRPNHTLPRRYVVCKTIVAAYSDKKEVDVSEYSCIYLTLHVLGGVFALTYVKIIRKLNNSRLNAIQFNFISFSKNDNIT